MPLPDNLHDLNNMIDFFIQETDRADLQIRHLDPKFQDYIKLFKQANNLLAFYNVSYKIDYYNFRRDAGRNFKNPEIVFVERPGRPGEENPDFEKEEWEHLR